MHVYKYYGAYNELITFGPVDVQVQTVLGNLDRTRRDGGEQPVDGMWPDRRVRDAGGLVSVAGEDAAPRRRRVHFRRREPQVAYGRLGERYAQIRPGPMSDLVERHLDAGNGSLTADVHHRRVPVTAAGPLRLHLTAAHADARAGRQLQQPSDPVAPCRVQRYHGRTGVLTAVAIV